MESLAPAKLNTLEISPRSSSCGDGFKLLLPNPNGYGCYGASLQVHPCNERSCPIDCIWSDWGPWSHCRLDKLFTNSTRLCYPTIFLSHSKSGRRRREAEAEADHYSGGGGGHHHPPHQHNEPASAICTQSRSR